MGNIRKKYVRTIDASRLLFVFSISFLVGVLLSKMGLMWPFCFGVIMILRLALGQISQKILIERLGEEYLVSKTVGFLLVSIALDLLLVIYLIINRQYSMLFVAAAIYIILLILRRMRH